MAPASRRERVVARLPERAARFVDDAAFFAILLCGPACLAVGVGLWKRRRWGRLVGLAVGGLAGLAASRYVVSAVPAAPPVAPIVAKPQPAPAPKPTPVATVQAPSPPPVRLALSRPPSLPPIAPRKAAVRTPEPAPQPDVTPSRWRKTPHLTGAALTRAP